MILRGLSFFPRDLNNDMEGRQKLEKSLSTEIERFSLKSRRIK